MYLSKLLCCDSMWAEILKSIFFVGHDFTKSILKAEPSDYQGFTFQMNDPRTTTSMTPQPPNKTYSNTFTKNFEESHNKQGRRVRLFLEDEQTNI